jgi:hypothetical protein
MTTKNLAFLPPFLKLEWAKQHIDELDARLKAFGESGIYRVGIDSDRDPLNDFVRVNMTRRLPFEVNLVLGDALHNLRAALDYMWREIGGKTITGRKKEFPIYPRRDLLEKFFLERPNEPFLVGIRALILDDVQPYKGGNGDALFALHKLNIVDKHEWLIPHLQVSAIEHVFVEDSEGRKHGVERIEFGSKREIWIGGKHGKLKLIDQGRASFTVVFSKGTLMEGKMILPTLRSFHVTVNRTLETLGFWSEVQNVKTP